MTLPVRVQDIVDALKMTADSTSYFLDRRTGKIEMITDDVWDAAENDDLISEYPLWQRELVLKAREIRSADHFVALPDKFEIDSYQMTERFCSEHPLARVREKLSETLKGTGSFRRFNDMISTLGIRDEWNRFEHQSFEAMAVEWLEAEGIPYTRGDEIELSAEM